jgi:hypothetical protein
LSKTISGEHISEGGSSPEGFGSPNHRRRLKVARRTD